MTLPKVTHLTLHGIFSSGGSGKLQNSCAFSLVQSQPKIQGSSCFIRILVLFLRHKGTQGVNDIRSLEEEGKGRNPNKSGRLKPWSSYTYFSSLSKELTVIFIHCLCLEIYRFQQLWLEAPFKESDIFTAHERESEGRKFPSTYFSWSLEEGSEPVSLLKVPGQV